MADHPRPEHVEGPILEQRLKEVLASAALERGPRPQDLCVRLAKPDDLPAAVAEMTRAGLGLASLVATDETGAPDQDLKVRYLFEPVRGEPPLADTFVTLIASLDPARPEVPSLTPELPCADWHEREARDLFGIAFAGHPDPRTLVLHDGWPKGLYPLRKSFDAAQRPPHEQAEEFPHLHVEGEGVMEVPVGPIHAGIIEPGHFRFSTAGEHILNLEARLFFTHRGLEKRCEGLPLEDAFFVAERICGVCSVSHALGFCEAAEQIARVQAPRRARFLRTLALELERLYNHVGDIGNIAAGASYHYGTSNGLRMREAFQQLNERISGHRYLRGLVCPGGVRQDLTPELAQSIEAVLASTAEALGDLMERIENNPSITDRLETTGLLKEQDAFCLGVSGIAARGSGINRDARRDHPHAAYGNETQLNVKVATETDGDVNARLMVRVAEIAESIRLVRALLAGLPPGPLAVEVPQSLPAWGVGQSAIESPRGAAVHWLRVDARGRVDRYHLRTPSFANWPAVALAAQSSIIPDFPLVNKSFELCYSCTDR
ncbi:MAG TPA: NADH-quinone oxidoreductase subunit C [Myxococcales bacterium]